MSISGISDVIIAILVGFFLYYVFRKKITDTNYIIILLIISILILVVPFLLNVLSIKLNEYFDYLYVTKFTTIDYIKIWGLNLLYIITPESLNKKMNVLTFFVVSIMINIPVKNNFITLFFGLVFIIYLIFEASMRAGLANSNNKDVKNVIIFKDSIGISLMVCFIITLIIGNITVLVFILFIISIIFMQTLNFYNIFNKEIIMILLLLITFIYTYQLTNTKQIVFSIFLGTVISFISALSFSNSLKFWDFLSRYIKSKKYNISV